MTVHAVAAEDACPKVLGKKLSLCTLALWQRTHPGWPVEATDVIMQFTDSELGRRGTLTR